MTIRLQHFFPFGDGTRRMIVSRLAKDYQDLSENLAHITIMLKDMGITDDRLALHYTELIATSPGVDSRVYNSLFQDWVRCRRLNPLLATDTSDNAGIGGTSQNCYEVSIRSFHNTLTSNFVIIDYDSDTMTVKMGKLLVDANDAVKIGEFSNEGITMVESIEQRAEGVTGTNRSISALTSQQDNFTLSASPRQFTAPTNSDDDNSSAISLTSVPSTLPGSITRKSR